MTDFNTLRYENHTGGFFLIAELGFPLTDLIVAPLTS